MGIFDFKWEATLGDIVLGVIAAVVTTVVTTYRFLLPRYPFTLKFFEKQWDTEDAENPSTDWKHIQCKHNDAQTFFIGVQLRTQRAFRTVDVRFVEREWWFWWKEVCTDIVRINAIRDQQRGWAIQDGTKGRDNKKGGCEASYEPIVDGLPRNTIMWYEVTATAYKDWNGWLSFQLRRGSSHKGHARARICFKII